MNRTETTGSVAELVGGELQGDAGRTIRGCLPSIGDEEARTLVLGFLQLFETSLAPVADELARGVIHSDGNDHNVLVRRVAPWRMEVAGVIDFGDMVHSFRVCEPAIAAAYGGTMAEVTNDLTGKSVAPQLPGHR